MPNRPQVVFTGKMRRETTRNYHRKAEEIGLDPAGALTSDTALVVAGEGPSAKLDKAKRLGVRVIDEDQWAEHLSKYVQFKPH